MCLPGAKEDNLKAREILLKESKRERQGRKTPLAKIKIKNFHVFMFSEMRLSHDSGHPGSLLEAILWSSSET